MIAAFALTCLSLVPALKGEDLARRYPGKLKWSGNGLSAPCGPDDVYALKSFELSFGKGFEVRCDEAEVALGVHDGNVLWAVVFPHERATIVSRDDPGDGETTDAIYLRFAPAEVGRVFPARTVAGPGDAWLRARAERITRHKIGHKWFTPSGNPTVVQPGYTLVDMDTDEGLRRFYELDANSGKLTYVETFEPRTLPPETPIEPAEAREVLEAAWKAYDETYANFGSVKGLDWDRAGDEARAGLGRVTTTLELGGLLADMVARLEDFHAWVRVGSDWMPSYHRERPTNASWNGALTRIGGAPTDTRHDLVWARTGDGIGYLNVHQLGDKALPDVFDEALEALGDTWGLVIDLRFNGGGDEGLAQRVAGRFAKESFVYSKNRYRSGPGRQDLGPELERVLEPRGPWRYSAPIVVLIGQRTMSSAESLALMLAGTPDATLIGDRTAGSSGNPRLVEFPCGIAVNVPRWQDLSPKGEPIEHVGVQPETEAVFPADAFGDETDPVVDAALKQLRKMPKGKRHPGREG